MVDKMADLFLNDRSSFDSILKKAKEKVDCEAAESFFQTEIPAFKEWFDKRTNKKCSYEMIMKALKEADDYLIGHKMSKESIFDISDAYR